MNVAVPNPMIRDIHALSKTTGENTLAIRRISSATKVPKSAKANTSPKNAMPTDVRVS